MSSCITDRFLLPSELPGKPQGQCKMCLHLTELILFSFSLVSFYLQKKKEEGIIDSSDKEIVAEAERLDVKAMGPLVLTEVLFNEKIREQIKKYRRHFLRVSK